MIGIRLARISDAHGIGRIHALSWKNAYRGILSDELLDAIDIGEWTEKRRRALEHPLGPSLRNWVLERGQDILGWACTGASRDDDLDESSHELMAIYLDPSETGKGYGRRLMAHCLGDVMQRGFVEMTMWVLAGNERAQRFYAAAGFAPDPRVSPIPFRDTGSMKLRMFRRLVS